MTIPVFICRLWCKLAVRFQHQAASRTGNVSHARDEVKPSSVALMLAMAGLGSVSFTIAQQPPTPREKRRIPQLTARTLASATTHIPLFPSGFNWLRKSAAFLILLFALSVTNVQGVDAVRQIYYVPITEEEVNAHYLELNNMPSYAGSMVVTVGISAPYDNTIIYYDQWENGFDTTISNPANIWSAGNLGGTQIWGDNNPANGMPPGYSVDVINAGSHIVLQDTSTFPHNLTTILYDGGDKIGTTKQIALTNVAWPIFGDGTGSSVDLAEGCSVLPTSAHGREFIAPVGINVVPAGGGPGGTGGSAAEMFESSIFCIMATSPGGSVVQVDADANGTFELTRTLAEGEAWSVTSIRAGAKVSASGLVQVHLLTGDIGAQQVNRWFTLYPSNLWSSDYISPVGEGASPTGTKPVNVFCYNAAASPITVTRVSTVGSTTFTVPANGVYQYQVADDSGARYYTTDGSVFQAVTTIDETTAHDWGASLVPSSLLSPLTIISYGPGSSDGTQNGSPIWVVPIKATTIYVDYDGDPDTGPLTDPKGGKYDVSYPVSALQSTRVFDPDKSQTGMRLYTVDDVGIFATWGEGPTAEFISPYIDAGTAVIPVLPPFILVGDRVWSDANSNGIQDSGELGIPNVAVQVYNTNGTPHQVRDFLGYYEDNFEPQGLGGTDGSFGWAGAWTVQNNAAVVLNTGTDYEMRIADDLNSTATRSFVVPANTDQLTISYQYRQGAGDDTVKAQFSPDNTNWTDLATYNSGSAGTGTASFDVTTTPGTRYVRFIKTALGGGVSNVEYMYFDNVSISVKTAPRTVTSTTDALGYYYFWTPAELVVGTNYQLRVATNQSGLSGFELTSQNQGVDDAEDSDATLATASGFATIPFTAPPLTASDITLDFGFRGNGQIGNQVWNDANNDGLLNNGESGINGVVVNLYFDSDDNGTVDPVERVIPYLTTTTAGSGNYTFANLPPGKFEVGIPAANFTGGGALVTASLSSTVTDTADNQQDNDDNGVQSGGTGTLVSSPTITLAAGEFENTLDFGFWAPVTLGSQVWNDVNANGVQDGGEPGLEGVTVILYRPGVGPDGISGNGDDDDPVATTTSAVSTGSYAFIDLPAGTYQVEFSSVAGYERSPANQGGDDSLDSDADTVSGLTQTVTLAPGGSDNTLDAGYFPLGSIAGTVRVDLDGDGVVDPEDTQPLAGVTIQLLDGSGNMFANTLTSLTGTYLFSNLPIGNYTVEQLLPSSYTNTNDVVPPNDRLIPRTISVGQNSTGNDFYNTRPIAATPQGKVLYLSDPSQAMDRVDPVATSDGTTALTTDLTTGEETISVVGAPVSSNAGRTATTHSFSYNSGITGTNRILMVGISYRNDDNETVNSVTYGGQALTSVGTHNRTTNGRVYIYQLLNPPTGSNSLSLTWSAALDESAVVGAVTYSGVSQTTPTGSFYSANGRSAAPSVTVDSALGQLLFGVVGGRTTSDYVVSNGGTLLWRQRPRSGETSGSGQSKDGASPNVALSWTGSNTHWVATGVSLRPAPIPVSTSFTQAPTFAMPFGLTSGTTITTTAHVEILSGSMPANPAITAELSVNGAPFLTVTNPSFANDVLTWTGNLPSNVNIATGQAITLNVTSIQDGVSFRIRYDSSTYPSRINLPTTSIIAVPSINVYDAPYPGGSALTDASITATRYVRIVVTDPFGASDITSVDLAIDGPGVGADLDVNLGAAQVVASNAWSKTYEYVWQTGALAGTYNLTATANEGTEGITAIGTTSDILYASTIGDRVFKDTNGNGQQDGGETGLAGISVELRDGGNQLLSTQVTSDGTVDVDGDGVIDPIGYYRFRNLPSATYNIVIPSAPAGYSVSYDENSNTTNPDGATQVVLAVNTQHMTADFGYLPSFVTISGQVRYDLDADGDPGDADSPAAFTSIQLWTDPNGDGNPADGAQVGETLTGLDGMYAFSDVPSGNYVILQTNISGASSTYDVQGSPTDDRIATQVIDQNITGRDFLDTQPVLYAISGAVYGDTEDDDLIGINDTLLPGINVSLYYDIDGDGSHSLSTDVFVASAWTNLSGSYSFAGLPPGQYIVVETVPSGTTAIFDIQGAATDGVVACTLLDADISGRDFLLDVSNVYSISGTVLNDTTNSGVIDNPGDTPLLGVVVQLRNGDGNLIDSVVTNASGAYSLPNLIPGDYRITTVNPADLDAVTDRDGNGNGPSRVDVTIISSSVIQRDFLLDTTPLKIAGDVFDDRDFDNQFTAPDTFRAGMKISLYRDADADGVADASEYIEDYITGTNGHYEFEDLAPGDYLVKLTPAQRCRFVNERGESVGNIGLLTDGQMLVSLGSADNLDNDFLLCRGIFLGAIGDRVWLDENSNGIQDPGEAGIANVTVRLYDATGAFVIAETVTDTDGYYLFPNRTAQTYVVRVDAATMPSGLAANATHDLDGLSSLHNATVVLPGDTLNRKVDFGYNWAPTTDVINGSNTGAIGNRLWIDADGDGVQDLGEAGLAGVTVGLYYDSNNDGTIDALYATTVTAADGSYIFDELTAGIYNVMVNSGTSPAGYVQTGDPDYFSVTLPSGERDNTTSQPIVLGPGDVFVNADFGYQLLSGARVISGTVYFDYDGDGVDAGPSEPGVRFVTAALLDQDGVVIARTMTNELGEYAFPGLPAGTYTVWIHDTYRQLGGRRLTEDPDAVIDAYHTLVINGSDPSEIDFGYAASEQRPGFGMVHGTVFLDRDNGSDLDVGESLRGVRVYLYDSTGATRLDDTQTDANGEYFFGGVVAGTYIVRIDESTLISGGVGLTNTVDPDSVSDSEFEVVLGTAEISNSLDFGYEPDAPRTISGTIWEDGNANGTLDPSEAGRFEGVVVVIFDIHGHELGWTYTDATGAYSFTGLPDGEYMLDIVEVGKMLYGHWSSYGTPEVPGESQTVAHSVTLNGGNENADFGLYLQPSSLGDFVWWDQDQDGIQDLGETGITGMPVELLITWPNIGGTTLIVRTTDSSGKYSFGNLLLDEHLNGSGSGEPVFTLRVQTEPGAASPVESASATDATDSNDSSGTAATVIQGESNLTTDFGFYNLYGSIAGSVSKDTTGNGLGDAAQAGVTIELLDGNGDPVDGDSITAGIQPTTTITATDGTYIFPNVAPGNYQIRQSVPPGYVAIDDVDDGDYTTIGDTTVITFADAQNLINQDFVNTELGSIAGFVLGDSDNDDIGDAPISGVTVQLYDGGNNLVFTTTTGFDGSYLFTDLEPGDYTVRETQPSGYASLSDMDGGDLDINGDITLISVLPGQEVTGQNFVEEEYGAITGSVLVDTNNDWVGDSPLAGVTLSLVYSNGNPVLDGGEPITTVTDEDGFYSFTNLSPGTFGVIETQPSGYVSLSDKDNGSNLDEILPILVEGGQTNEDNDFIEISGCPDTWPDWKQLHPDEIATGNPDGDEYVNFTEFAFAMPYDSGIGSEWLDHTAWIIRESGIAPGTVEGVFIRPAGAYLNVVYSLQYASVIGDPTSWTTIAITPQMISVVPNGDCTETVTIHDLETLTGLGTGTGVVRLKADLDDDGGNDEVNLTTYTEPEGWTRTDCAVCCQSFNNPYARESVFTGTIASVSGQNVSFDNENLGTLLEPGSFYYIEVATGQHEGHRFDVTSATTGGALVLAPDSDLHVRTGPFNTMTGAPPETLVGARVALRRHWTLAGLFPPLDYVATGSAETADQVQVFAKDALNAPGAWKIYWLYDLNDGNANTAIWVDAADGAMNDQANVIIPPGQGMLFNNRGTARTKLSQGEVRVNDFIRPLPIGRSFVGGGFPLDQSAGGARSRQMTKQVGFFGSRDFKTADSFYLWKADTILQGRSYATYFLHDATPRDPALIRWVVVGDNLIAIRDAEIHFMADRAVFIRTKNGLPTYTIPSPWAP